MNFLGFPTAYGADSLCASCDIRTVARCRAAAGPAAALPDRPTTTESSVERAKAMPNRRGKPAWPAFQTTACAISPTSLCSPPTACGGTTTCICWTDTANGGAPCLGAPSGWAGAGGTSFSSPILAGIQALVNQKQGSAQGNPNYVYYKLAAKEYGAQGSSTCDSSNGPSSATAGCIFHDVTMGDIVVNCAGSANCYGYVGNQRGLLVRDPGWRAFGFRHFFYASLRRGSRMGFCHRHRHRGRI